jgi:hypothetical protein
MKLFILLLSTFLISVSNKTLITHKSQNYPYSIQVPSKFTKIIPKGKNIDFRFEQDFNLIIVHVSKREPFEYKTTTHDNLLLNYKKSDLKERLIKFEKIVISDEKCLLTYYKRTIQGLKTINIEAYIYHKENVYMVTCTSLEINYENNRDNFLKTIKSIKFIK